MGIQTRYKRETDHFAEGTLVDMTGDVKTRINKDPKAKQVDEISVSGAQDDTTYKVKIEFRNEAVIIPVTTDSNATQDELVQTIADAINAEKLVSGRLVAEADTGSDTVTITARYAGYGWTASIYQDSPGHLSHSNTTPNANAVEVPFGRALEAHGVLDNNHAHKFARLPDASNMTARDIKVTLDAYTDGDYRLVIKYLGGQTFVSEYSASGDDINTVLTNLESDINTNGPNVLTASTSGSGASTELHLNPETAGFADFEIQEADGPEQFNVSIDAEGDDFVTLFDGVSVDGSPRQIEPDVVNARYQPGSSMNVLNRDGRVAVSPEKRPSSGNYVWVRLSVNGSNDQKGAFRPDYDSGAIPLPKDVAMWDRVDDDGLATIELR